MRARKRGPRASGSIRYSPQSTESRHVEVLGSETSCSIVPIQLTRSLSNVYPVHFYHLKHRRFSDIQRRFSIFPDHTTGSEMPPSRKCRYGPRVRGLMHKELDHKSKEYQLAAIKLGHTNLVAGRTPNQRMN